MLVDKTGKVKLADFGSAQMFDSSTFLMSTDAKRSIGGTLNYIAPEVFQVGYILRDSNSKEIFTTRSDVWSLGCTLLEIVNQGNFLWDCPTKGFEQIQRFKIPTDVSPELRNFIYQCVIKDYTRRPRAVQLLKHPFIVSCALLRF